MIPHQFGRHFVVFAALLASAENLGTFGADSGEIPQWKQFLGWLPEDTETIIVSQGSLDVQPKAELSELQNAWYLATGPLFRLEDAILGKALRGRKVICAVEGSRRFTVPKRFGMMLYQGAHFVQFEPGDRDLVRKAFQDCRSKAQKTIELAGEPVAVFTEKQQEDVWTYFVAQPRPGLLICATEQAYLEESLKRMTRQSMTRALPDDLPEWKQVDVKAPIWGLRHYSKKFADQDISSPLAGKSAPEVSDPAAVGLVFWYNPGPEKVARVRYLSGATDALKIATRIWNVPSEGLTPQIKQSASGSIEIVASFSDDRTVKMFMFALLWQLGHAIIL